MLWWLWLDINPHLVEKATKSGWWCQHHVVCQHNPLHHHIRDLPEGSTDLCHHLLLPLLASTQLCHFEHESLFAINLWASTCSPLHFFHTNLYCTARELQGLITLHHLRDYLTDKLSAWTIPHNPMNCATSISGTSSWIPLEFAQLFWLELQGTERVTNPRSNGTFCSSAPEFLQAISRGWHDQIFAQCGNFQNHTELVPSHVDIYTCPLPPPTNQNKKQPIQSQPTQHPHKIALSW